MTDFEKVGVGAAEGTPDPVYEGNFAPQSQQDEAIHRALTTCGFASRDFAFPGISVYIRLCCFCLCTPGMK
jgi:hypothetical protein